MRTFLKTAGALVLGSLFAGDAIAAAIDVAWDIAVGADLAFPQVPGERTAKVDRKSVV